MANYADIINKAVGNLFANQLPGLTVDLVIRYLVSAGTYDPVTDSETTPITIDLYLPNVIKARSSYEDVRDRGAVLNTTKFIIPGQTITREFDTSVDRVLYDGKMVNGVYTGGKDVNLQKLVGIPGDFSWTLYTNR